MSDEYRIVDLGCFQDVYYNQQSHSIPRYAVMKKDSVKFIEESDDLEDLCTRYNVNPDHLVRYNQFIGSKGSD